MRSNRLFATPHIMREPLPDGAVLLRSTNPLRASVPGVAHWLRKWAAIDPDHPLVAERGPDGAWQRVGYGAAWSDAQAIGQALLDRGLSAERPLIVLSGNTIGHLFVMLGALSVGIPVAPVSVAYSLQSSDHARIKMIDALVEPGGVYAEDAQLFAPALAALGSGPVVLSRTNGPGEHRLEALCRTVPTDEVHRAFAGVGRDTVAKILFTSGSTGTPKGVITTHGMLTANQQMVAQVWPFLEAERPVLVDWLPWSHTFGGNHNLNMVLAHGRTLYIDDGRPVPGLFERTLGNYRAVAPTVCFNVPAGYAQLVPALERDRDFARHFFSRLRLVFNASAALPPMLRSRLQALARETSDRDIPVTGAWGTTETAPAATGAHYPYTDPRCIGVPLPGVEVKLVPVDADSYEIRVRGELVSPGYYRRPDLSAAAVDDDGFYRPGDAVSFADPGEPNAGLLFRGRISEDFKLLTGTFVHVGAVRTALLSATPILADAVITGENRDEVCALAWLNMAEVRTRFTDVQVSDGEVVEHAGLAAELATALASLNNGAGSAARVARLLVMARPADLDLGEITDKGYVNQRAVLRNRGHLVEHLYTRPTPSFVITAQQKQKEK
jgi:feruloyl-CoA synthase